MKLARTWVLSLLMAGVLGFTFAPSTLFAAPDRLNPKVLAAFRDVVKESTRSTVQVFSDGKKSGLGAVVTSDGHILTKASELRGKLQCQVYDGRKLDATLIAKEHGLDLAVLKIEATDLPVVPWAEGDAPPVGSFVVTTSIDTDPLSIGVLSVAPRKIPAPAGALGVMLANSDKVAQIDDIVPASAADKAGLQKQDVILKVNGKEIAGRQSLIDTVRGYQPNEKIELVVKRGSEELTLTAQLGSLTALQNGPNPDRAEFQNNLGGSLSDRKAGFPSVIQHDTTLKPSECGGPLVGLDGRVIGINIARAGRVETYALPTSVVKTALQTLLANPNVAKSNEENLANQPSKTSDVNK